MKNHRSCTIYCCERTGLPWLILAGALAASVSGAHGQTSAAAEQSAPAQASANATSGVPAPPSAASAAPGPVFDVAAIHLHIPEPHEHNSIWTSSADAAFERRMSPSSISYIGLTRCRRSASWALRHGPAQPTSTSMPRPTPRLPRHGMASAPKPAAAKWKRWSRRCLPIASTSSPTPRRANSLSTFSSLPRVGPNWDRPKPTARGSTIATEALTLGVRTVSPFSPRHFPGSRAATWWTRPV